jgi:hypothetical protein
LACHPDHVNLINEVVATDHWPGMGKGKVS